MSCSTCRFSDIAIIELDGGETPHRICRRLPPGLVDVDGLVTTVWPLVNDGDWCGEHRPLEQVEANT